MMGKHYRIMRIVKCPCYQYATSTMIVSYSTASKKLQSQEVKNFELSENDLSKLNLE
jgi:hypothetical protein